MKGLLMVLRLARLQLQETLEVIDDAREKITEVTNIVNDAIQEAEDDDSGTD